MEWVAIYVLLALVLVLVFYIDHLLKQVKRLESARSVHAQHIAKLQQTLSMVVQKLGMRDGEVVRQITEHIDEELEKSATLTEMRQAKRRTIPRENAGPPARVSKLRLHRK